MNRSSKPFFEPGHRLIACRRAPHRSWQSPRHSSSRARPLFRVGSSFAASFLLPRRRRRGPGWRCRSGCRRTSWTAFCSSAIASSTCPSGGTPGPADCARGAKLGSISIVLRLCCTDSSGKCAMSRSSARSALMISDSGSRLSAFLHLGERFADRDPTEPRCHAYQW